MSRVRTVAPALLLALPLFALILVAHGFVPGMVNAGTISYWTQGSIACVHDLGAEMFTSRCRDFGEPAGFPLLTGGPVIYLGALLMYLPDVEAYGAYVLSGAAFMGLAFAGAFALMRRLGAGAVIAVVTAAAWLLSPTIIGMQGFGGTLEGFALLPAYAFVDLVVIRALPRAAGGRLAALLAAYALIRTLALFLDGYSFFASALVGAALWIAWLAKADSRRVAGAAAFLGANAVAAILYLLYVPGDYAANPIEIYRALGLDVVTLVVPTDRFWAFDAIGLTGDHRDLWGDTSNALFNYAGLACVVLAAWVLARREVDRSAVAIAVAGVVALLLALGPTVKLDEVRPVAGVSYAMPAGEAVDLPWGPLYADVPGIESMRATYRWFGVTRMALIVLAGLAVAALWRRRRARVLVAALGVLAVVELLPNVPLMTDAYERQDRDRNAFRADVVGDLQAATESGERAFFLNVDGTHNDFLVNYLAPQVGVRAFNAGGDKNATIAIESWPPEIAALAPAGVGADAVVAALQDGPADVVVAPFFHLSQSSYAWPPPDATRAGALAAFAPILGDPRLAVERHVWFATVRLTRAAARQ